MRLGILELILIRQTSARPLPLYTARTLTANFFGLSDAF